jgi:hypothetical protein
MAYDAGEGEHERDTTQPDRGTLPVKEAASLGRHSRVRHRGRRGAFSASIRTSMLDHINHAYRAA